MKVRRAVHTLDELEGLMGEVGPLVGLRFASSILGVHNSRLYQLGEAGSLRIFAVDGLYHVPLLDLKERLRQKAAGELVASRPAPAPREKPRRSVDAWLVRDERPGAEPPGHWSDEH